MVEVEDEMKTTCEREKERGTHEHGAMTGPGSPPVRTAKVCEECDESQVLGVGDLEEAVRLRALLVLPRERGYSIGRDQ